MNTGTGKDFDVVEGQTFQEGLGFYVLLVNDYETVSSSDLFGYGDSGEDVELCVALPPRPICSESFH